MIIKAQTVSVDVETLGGEKVTLTTVPMTRKVSLEIEKAKKEDIDNAIYVQVARMTGKPEEFFHEEFDQFQLAKVVNYLTDAMAKNAKDQT